MSETYNPLFDKDGCAWFLWGVSLPGEVPGGGVIIKRRLMPISERPMSICGKQREWRYLNKSSAEARQRNSNCEDDGFEDCDCGYTHHYEDKCPNEETAHHYVRWGEQTE